MSVTSTYAALLALLFVALSVRTLRLRNKLSVAFGDAGQATLLRAIRVHGNFAEYVPFALLLMAMLEWRGVQSTYLHALGIALLAGRLAHAWGVSRAKENFRWRIAGMSLTLSVLGLAALALLALALRS